MAVVAVTTVLAAGALASMVTAAKGPRWGAAAAAATAGTAVLAAGVPAPAVAVVKGLEEAELHPWVASSRLRRGAAAAATAAAAAAAAAAAEAAAAAAAEIWRLGVCGPALDNRGSHRR